MESCSLLIVPHFRLNVDSDSSEALVTVVSHFSGVSIPKPVTGVVAGVERRVALRSSEKGEVP